MPLECPSTEEWMQKMWGIYIYGHMYMCKIEYYSTIKKNEIRPFATTWMGLEFIILTEVSQKEKDKHHMLSLLCGIFF